MFGRLLSNIYHAIPSFGAVPLRQFSAILTQFPAPSTATNWVSVRNLWVYRKQVRNNWPRPREVKKIRTLGWEKKMTTLHGRKILMRRILRGRCVLSH